MTESTVLATAFAGHQPRREQAASSPRTTATEVTAARGTRCTGNALAGSTCRTMPCQDLDSTETQPCSSPPRPIVEADGHGHDNTHLHLQQRHHESPSLGLHSHRQINNSSKLPAFRSGDTQ